MNLTPYPTVCHKDGTVSYWSVMQQVRVRRARTVPAAELAAMSRSERRRVQRHLARMPGREAARAALVEAARRGDLDRVRLLGQVLTHWTVTA